MVDPARLRDLYSGYSDDELQRIWRTDLVAEARLVLQEEMQQRGLGVTLLTPDAGEAEAKPRARLFSNPYLPPGALLADPKEAAVLSARGLVRLFQYLLIGSILMRFLFWILEFVPLPISEQARAMRDAAGFDAWNPMASWFIAIAVQLVLVVCAFAMCFFKWWARWVYVIAYAMMVANGLVSGTGVVLAWEGALYHIEVLMNGAILALAFLPPLSRYFEADRKAT